ncbi:ROK family protein [Spirulina subsalsa]|uniref:ROK family protein n=1 Tax=Spirulina subsalsa TaxID=54311 RepID=UPI00031A26E8|nr:ROK family protein [Spirulina subsalsa]
MSIYLGVDIGASTVKLGLFDPEKGVIGERLDRPSSASEGPEATVNVIKTATSELLEANDLQFKDLKAIGACCPTPIDASGMCVYPTNIDRSWQGVNVSQKLSEALQLPALLLNDGDAAAYREYSVREAQNKASSVMAQFITGTGLGGALIINGKIWSAPAVSAELGHICIDSSENADPCGCGARGCVETRSSLLGLRNMVKHRQAQGNVPEALQGEPMEVAKILRRLGQMDDPLSDVVAIWQEYFTSLGIAARNVVNTVGCDLIVISGGAQEREKTASDGAYERFKQEAISSIRQGIDHSFPHLTQTRVEWSIDTLPDSAAYGAAQYASVIGNKE